MSDRESRPRPGSAVRFGLAVVLIVAVGVAMRSLPLFQSPLPFNPDGIGYARRASVVLDTGTLPLAGLGTDAVGFTAFLTVASDVTGVPPMLLAQPIVAVIGTLPVLLAVTLGRRFARRLGTAPARARWAGGLGGLVLAVDGLYLHRSMPVDEQTVGLFLLPLGVLAASRGYRDGDWRWYGAGAVVLVALPPLHNLETMIAAIALALLPLVARRSSLRQRVPLVGMALGFWLVAAGYHLAMAELTPARIVQSARVLDFPGLLLAWGLVIGLILFGVVRASVTSQRALVVGVLGSWFALLLANALRSVFPGTPATSPMLSFGLLPLIVPVVLAAWAVPTWSDPGGDGPVFWALFGSVLVMIGFSLTAALTPEYVNTVYRAQTFLHLPIMTSAGVGVVVVGGWLDRRTASGGSVEGPDARWAGERPPTPGSGWGRSVGSVLRRSLRVVVVLLLLASVVASVPIAIGGLDVVPYKGVTTPAERSASAFAAGHVNGSWASDDHLVRIAPTGGGTRRPVYRWVHDGGMPPQCPTVSQRSWTTTGAQLYPAPPARLSPARYERALRTRQLVYVATGRDPIVVTLARTGNATASDCTT